jgi:dihydroorotase-like cyclic amidohydrolase
MSDANVLVHCREPELSESDEAGIMAAAVELGCFHFVDQANRTVIAATREVHRLTLLLEEREATIAALLAKPRLRVVREDDWIDRKHDSEVLR